MEFYSTSNSEWEGSEAWIRLPHLDDANRSIVIHNRFGVKC